MGIEEKVGWNVGLMFSILSEIISCYLSICYQIGWNGWNRNYSKTYLSLLLSAKTQNGKNIQPEAL